MACWLCNPPSVRWRRDSWNSLKSRRRQGDEQGTRTPQQTNPPYLEWSHLRIRQCKPTLCGHSLCPTLCLGYCTLSVEDDLQLDAKTCPRKDILHLLYTTSMRNARLPLLELNNLKERQLYTLVCSTSAQPARDGSSHGKHVPLNSYGEVCGKEPVCLHLEFSRLEVFYFPFILYVFYTYICF